MIKLNFLGIFDERDIRERRVTWQSGYKEITSPLNPIIVLKATIECIDSICVTMAISWPHLRELARPFSNYLIPFKSIFYFFILSIESFIE